MSRVAHTSLKQFQHLVRPAQYNLGRAYYQGVGVKRSDEEAERSVNFAVISGVHR